MYLKSYSGRVFCCLSESVGRELSRPTLRTYQRIEAFAIKLAFVGYIASPKIFPLKSITFDADVISRRNDVIIFG